MFLRKVIFIGLFAAMQLKNILLADCCYSENSCFWNPGCVSPCTEGGDWITRLRALYIYPDSSSGRVKPIPDTGVCVHSAWTGEFDIGYMFTKHIGAELILSTTKHNIYGKKSLAGTKIGSTWLLPPCLTLQWRFLPEYFLQPYVGGGVNYTWFYNDHCSLEDTRLRLDNSWGGVVQAGADIFFNENWFVNFDIKYLWLDTKAHLHGNTKGRVHVDINPLIIGLGIGRKW